MKILITGVAGFIGSNLLERVLAEGHEVVGIDDLSMGNLGNIASALDNPSFEFLERDITVSESLSEISGIDRVVHLAAKKIPRYQSALATLTVNYEGTRTVLDLAARLGAKTVLASTSDVYGRNPRLPFSEAESDSVIGSSLSPRWAYAVSKLFDEHLGLAYQDDFGFPVTLLRFFGSYGPRQHLSWWGGPQSVFIDAILKGEAVPIHGDGSQTRTFAYIDDTVEGTYRAMTDDSANGEVLNIGSTTEITILGLAHLINDLCGNQRELAVDFISYESFTGKVYQDVMRRVPDVSLAKQLLGFVARTPLEEGLEKSIEWHRSVTR